MEKTNSKTAGKSKPNRTRNGVNIRTQFDPSYKGSKGESNNGKSLTVPDMSLTVQKLLLNHTRGIHSDIHVREPQFFGVEIPKFDDITELVSYKAELKAKYDETEKQFIKEKAELKQANIDRAREKAQKLQKDALIAAQADLDASKE